jgi:hypothetical protein
MGIPLLRGRGIAAEDLAGGEPVAVVSKALAASLFPDIEAAAVIGKKVAAALDDSLEAEPSREVFTIVGVTADFVAAELGQAQEQLLLPLAQHPASTVFLVARTAAGDEPAVKIAAAFQNAVRDLDADLKAPTVLTGRELRERSMRAFLMQSAGVGAPGGVVLGLAALGIYGVMGLMVATRTREMALRMALGASRRRVMGKVLFDVVKLVVPGVGGGLLIAGILVRVFREDLGLPLSSVEHLAYVAAAAIAVLVAVAASLAPARRAASVPPMVAMRLE